MDSQWCSNVSDILEQAEDVSRGGGLWASEGHMRGDMGDMASPQGRGRQRDRTDVFADESQALDEIAKQVRSKLSFMYIWFNFLAFFSRDIFYFYSDIWHI